MQLADNEMNPISYNIGYLHNSTAGGYNVVLQAD